ncbi:MULTISPECIES: carbohydrate kinase [unclassified Pseudodesulfovibrio]|uniref:carbohydrate kinase family protein n=1 Tax=unclassified Pseudodesulfovibrio TaxID=2661612 RepID=UPI000FEB5D7E|nr:MULTISPECIES: carbohydrate kinase [unclassified Pseudodesulfovibrio]MCJ2165712.1 carbohydrate kinase [Pseudodesulfovibrio sp. S3-i]RWU02973.1 carbohydrate kinase [Pseudodesulfovibrio sp. S3]
MPQFLAVGLGEILWDVLPDTRLLGGAPANFAYHINALGGVGVPVSRVGDDDLGREALSLLVDYGLNVDAVSLDRAHPTGTVNASIDADGVATYAFPDNVAWDFLTLDEAALTLAAKADAVCFGSLAQRSAVSRQAVHQFLHAAPNALKVYDINLRQNFFTSEIITSSLDLADVLKINEDELATVTAMFSLPRNDRAALNALMKKHGLKLAVLTRGHRGSLLLSPDDMSDLPGHPVEVKDTIGAGDSFTAALVLGLLLGWPLEAINRRAAAVAAHVCGQAGAMPTMPETLMME